MEIFIPKLKLKYKERCINREKQWPRCHGNKLVRLQLVKSEKGEGYSANFQRGRDDKMVKRIPLPYIDLFKVEKGKNFKPIRKILVEGDAGIGKTTLSISLSEDWAHEKLFQEFELLLLLPLRHKEVASVGSLTDLLKLLHPSYDVCKAVAGYVENEEEKVLIIADGWDELSESDQQEGSFLFKLLFETFPLMSVVLTSRPSASAPLHRLPCIDRFVEINGFSKEDIKEYIESEFTSDQEKASRLLEQLEDNPLVESVCSIPLNSAIICHLWRTLEEDLPSTMTQLYTKIILNVILRNIQKKEAFKNVSSLLDFNHLPKDLQPSFTLLCKFAFQSLKKSQIVFSQEELVEIFPSGLALVLSFGLLQSAETVLETGHGVSFHFIHLTFMEYLAALHFVELPQCLQLEEFCQEVNYQFFEQPQHTQFEVSSAPTNRSTMIWRFYFGIVCSLTTLPEKCVLTRALEFVRRTCSIIDFRLPLYHCAFEAQNSFIAKEVIRLTDTVFLNKNFGDPHTAFDCAAVLQIISNTEECNCMDISFINCGVREKQIRTLTDILESKQGKLRINMLNITGNNLGDKCLSHLFQRAYLGIHPIIEGQPRPYRGINTLYLSNNPLGISGLQALESAVCNNLFLRLSHLSINGSLTCDTLTNDKWLNTFMPALSAYCPYLQHLNLSHNKIGMAGASAIGRAVSLLKSSVIGLMLFLNYTNIDLKIFVDNVARMFRLFMLELSGNDINAAGVTCLADAVCSGKIVFPSQSSLDIQYNLLVNGSLAVGKMLSNANCCLTYVNLSKCKLAESKGHLAVTDSLKSSNSMCNEALLKVGQQLYVLPKNHTIETLVLDGNIFTGDGIYILAGLVHLCSGLKRLSSCDCGITSNDLKVLLLKLTELKFSSKKLESWNLANNIIDDIGVSIVMTEMLSLFPSLKPFRIIFYNNKLTSELNQMLKELQEGKGPSEWEALLRQLNLQSEQSARDHLSLSENRSSNVSHSSSEEEPSCIHPTTVDVSLTTQTDRTTSDNQDPVVPCTSQRVCVENASSEGTSSMSTHLVQEDAKVNEANPLLTENDLASIQRAAWEGRSKWYNLGLELRLTTGTLDAIQQTNHHVTDDCFRDTLKTWLRNTDLHPSWSSLAKALRAPPVGLDRLTEQLPNPNAST